MSSAPVTPHASERLNDDQSLLISQLSIHYQGADEPAVVGVDLRVAPGEIVGIIGESGSGKSTIAMASIGLLPASARLDGAALRVAGNEISELSENQLCRVRGTQVSMIFQEPMTALNPTTRIWKQIAEVFALHGICSRSDAKRRARELLELVKLPDPEVKMRQYPHQLSGGQRQRVMIAIAIAASPKLLIADEATTALDVTVQAQILALISELRDRIGMGVLLISHDLGVVGAVCDRVVVMNRGRIVEEGDPRVVLRAPAEAYTRGLLRSLPRAEHPPRTPLPVVRDGVEAEVAPSTGPSSPAPTDADRLIEFRGICKVFRGPGGTQMKALDDVSLEVRRGETFGIVGESGSGKSTLAKIALQLERATEGTVLFDGDDVSRLRGEHRRRQRARVQMVFQDPNDSLDPRMPILSSVAEPLLHLHVTRAERLARAARILEEVGIPQSSHQRQPQAFSGGQRQRIAIARAMVTNPDFVILDEPTSALDISVQAQVLNLLLDLQRRTNVTYLFISHNLAVVRHMSHRIAVLNKGRLVESGEAEEVFTHPQDDYTRLLLDSVPQLERYGDQTPKVNS